MSVVGMKKSHYTDCMNKKVMFAEVLMKGVRNTQRREGQLQGGGDEEWRRGRGRNGE